MKTSAALKIKSAKELLANYHEYRKEAVKNLSKADKMKKSILQLLSSIPPSEAQLHKEKIDAIIVKL